MAATEEKLLREMFSEMDADGSGSVDGDEVAQLAKALGAPLDAAELAEAMREMDADGSGEVDFDEFKGWWGGQKGKKSKWAAALDAARQQRIQAMQLKVGRLEGELAVQRQANAVKDELEMAAQAHRRDGWVPPAEPPPAGSADETAAPQSAWPHHPAVQPHEYLGRRTCRSYPNANFGPRIGTVAGWLPANADARVHEAFRVRYDGGGELEVIEAEQVFQGVNAAERIAAEVAADLRSAMASGLPVGMGALALKRLRLAAALLRAAKGRLMHLPDAVAAAAQAAEIGTALRLQELDRCRQAGTFAAQVGRFAAMFELAAGKTPPLPCVPADFVPKTVPFLATSRPAPHCGVPGRAGSAARGGTAAGAAAGAGVAAGADPSGGRADPAGGGALAGAGADRRAADVGGRGTGHPAAGDGVGRGQSCPGSPRRRVRRGRAGK